LVNADHQPIIPLSGLETAPKSDNTPYKNLIKIGFNFGSPEFSHVEAF